MLSEKAQQMKSVLKLHDNTNDITIQKDFADNVLIVKAFDKPVLSLQHSSQTRLRQPFFLTQETHNFWANEH